MSPIPKPNLNGFSTQYARARDIGLEHWVDEMMEIAADRTRDARCRSVEIDAIKWRACKLAPKKYGDRLELDAKVDGTVTLSAAETLRRRRLERDKQEEKQ